MATQPSENRTGMTGGEIVIEAMIKILPDQLSIAEPAPSESGLASEVVR
jgi:hypothetical protein